MIPDLHRLAKRFQRGVASLQDVVRAYQVIIRLPAIVSSLAACETGSPEHKEIMDAEFTSLFEEYTSNLQKLQELVETTIDLDAIDSHEYLIKADFDQGLKGKTGDRSRLRVRHNCYLKNHSVTKYQPASHDYDLVLRKNMETLKLEMQREHERVSVVLNMEVDKKLKMEDHQIHGWGFRLSRNVRNRDMSTCDKTTLAFISDHGWLLASRIAKPLTHTLHLHVEICRTLRASATRASSKNWRHKRMASSSQPHKCERPRQSLRIFRRNMSGRKAPWRRKSLELSPHTVQSWRNLTLLWHNWTYLSGMYWLIRTVYLAIHFVLLLHMNISSLRSTCICLFCSSCNDKTTDEEVRDD